jgi:hypothetical protein
MRKIQKGNGKVDSDSSSEYSVRHEKNTNEKIEEKVKLVRDERRDKKAEQILKSGCTSVFHAEKNKNFMGRQKEKVAQIFTNMGR